MTPKVSVIIPCYNHGRYIKETVDSVLSQTFQDFEIVIADDCSNDGTTPSQIAEVAKTDERIKVVTLPKNRGLPGARNAAIKHATGQYILPLDADDMIAPTYLEKAARLLDEKKGDVIYCMQVQKFGKSNRIMKVPSNPEKFMRMQNGIGVCCAMYERIHWEKYGGYKEDMRAGSEDWDFWLCFFEDGKKFTGIDEPLFLFRMDDNSSSRYAFEHRKEIFRQIKNYHPNLYTIRGYYLSQAFIVTKLKEIIKFLFHFRWSRHKKYLRIFGVYFIDKRD